MCWWWMIGDTIFMPTLRVIPSERRNHHCPAEVKRLLDDFSKLVIGSPTPNEDKRRQIWDEIPHTSMDNYFSGNPIVKYVGKMGDKSTWTTACDRLPQDILK